MMVSCTPDCNISPVEMIFGWPIQDVFSFISWKEKFNNPLRWATWRKAWGTQRRCYESLHACHVRNGMRLLHAKGLLPLSLGDDHVTNRTNKVPVPQSGANLGQSWNTITNTGSKLMGLDAWQCGITASYTSQ